MKLLAAFALLIACASYAAEPCQMFHGRARFYSADGQFRIWHIGTHHEFMPSRYVDQDEWGHGWDRVLDLLNKGNPHPSSPSDQQLFADFTVCPIEPFHQGAAQSATVKSIRRAHIVPWTN